MVMRRRPLIAVVGNTGVGKSQFAVDLAHQFAGEVINADAMQMYRGLDVVTNKHPVAERQGVPHHLMGFAQWDMQLTVHDFEKEATSLIDHIHAQNKLPILVGGTHYYIQSALIQNATVSQNRQVAIQKIELTSDQKKLLDNPTLVDAKLKEVDPVVAAKFHPNDTRRLRRALEIWFETGQKASDIYEQGKNGTSEESMHLRYDVMVFWVWCERTVLAQRLDTRVNKMVSEGLLSEVEEMFHHYDSNAPQTGIWQVIGFRQFLPYLKDREALNWEAGIKDMQAETRQYAKRQTKWIRNKLSPLVTKLGGEVAVVDATDLSTWDVNVRDRGLAITKAWLEQSTDAESPPLVPAYLNDVIQRQRAEFGPEQWVRHRCEACSQQRGSDLVIIGDYDWKAHLNSKSHRHASKSNH